MILLASICLGLNKHDVLQTADKAHAPATVVGWFALHLSYAAFVAVRNELVWFANVIHAVLADIVVTEGLVDTLSLIVAEITCARGVVVAVALDVLAYAVPRAHILCARVTIVATAVTLVAALAHCESKTSNVGVPIVGVHAGHTPPGLMN
jgi:hypothetical protein